MTPIDLQLAWRRNAPDASAYTLLDDDGVTPVDLTGFGFRMQLRLYPGAPGDALATLAMASEGAPGFYLDDAAGGQFTLTPPASAALEAFPAPADVTTGLLDTLAYDVLLIHPDGVLEPFAAGTLRLFSGVTI